MKRSPWSFDALARLSPAALWASLSCLVAPVGASADLGACCFPDGSCEVLAESVCEERGGQFAGESADCVPTPCVGACCLPYGGCESYTEEECLRRQGEFLSLFEPCEPTLCHWGGVCCVPEGCLWLTPWACADSLGQYIGGEERCESCRGACCLTDGSCVWVFEAVCAAVDGSFEGILTECSPQLCSPSGVPDGAATERPRLLVSPNPVGSVAMIEFRTRTAAPGRLLLVGPTGRIAHTTAFEGRTDVHRIAIPVGAVASTGLAAGIYYVLVQAGPFQASGTLVVAR